MPPESAAVSHQEMATAKDSYRRCCAADGFFPSFYRNFFATAPEVEALFANTDFTRQHKLLQHAIGLLLNFPNQQPSEPTILSRVAERHSRRDLDIAPSLYPAFVESLMKTVGEYDSEFTPEVDRAWRNTVEPGIKYMQSAH